MFLVLARHTDHERILTLVINAQKAGGRSSRQLSKDHEIWPKRLTCLFSQKTAFLYHESTLNMHKTSYIEQKIMCIHMALKNRKIIHQRSRRSISRKHEGRACAKGAKNGLKLTGVQWKQENQHWKWKNVEKHQHGTKNSFKFLLIAILIKQIPLPTAWSRNWANGMRSNMPY